jgi:hypothetical protein
VPLFTSISPSLWFIKRKEVLQNSIIETYWSSDIHNIGVHKDCHWLIYGSWYMQSVVWYVIMVYFLWYLLIILRDRVGSAFSLHMRKWVKAGGSYYRIDQFLRIGLFDTFSHKATYCINIEAFSLSMHTFSMSSFRLRMWCRSTKMKSILPSSILRCLCCHSPNRRYRRTASLSRLSDRIITLSVNIIEVFQSVIQAIEDISC